MKYNPGKELLMVDKLSHFPSSQKAEEVNYFLVNVIEHLTVLNKKLHNIAGTTNKDTALCSLHKLAQTA